ncbi:MAG: acyl-CoA oxidase [Thermoleophilaceae bacterium]|nr:acyl-CoA oxidase [Thermoleophilaceae bacterium]
MSETMTARSESGAADATALRRYLDGEHREVKERVRERLTDERFAPAPTEIDRGEYRELVMRWMRMLAEDGEATILFPEEYGGQGNLGGGISAFEMLGHSDLSLLVKCGVNFGLFGGAVLHLGSEEHRKEYLPRVMSAELPGCFAMSETGHGSDVQRLGTTATYDSEAGEFVIRTPDEESRKDYIGNAAVHGKIAAVFAQLIVDGENHGVHALLVPLRDDDGNCLSGIRIEDCGHKLGLNGVDNGRIWFDDVRVPRTALLDRYGRVSEDGKYETEIENDNRRFFTTIGTLIQGRVSVAGAALSATKSALTIAIRYGLHRRQFGPPGSDEEMPLLDYRVHQRRLLIPLANTYAQHFAQLELVGELHNAFTGEGYDDREKRKLEAFAAGVKAASTWNATSIIQTCREACGGAGYLAENRFAALKADTDVFTTFEGDNTVLMQLVAKGLLTDYSERFGDLSRLEMVRFVGEQAYEIVAERTLARQLVTRLADAVKPSTNGDDEGNIEERDYQLDLFRWREEHMLSAVTRRLKRGIDDGNDQFEVFNDCQDHVLQAARAHVDTQILEAFARGVERCEDESLKPLLESLFSLHALSLIEAERGWFFEHGRMTGPRSKGVTRLVNRLCSELRPNAGLLVDAFGIPDQALAAPIALGDS